MNRSKITIMTEPIDMKFKVKRLLKKHKKYGGHEGVTRSLIEGFEKANFHDYNYRPTSKKEIAEQVHVLAGADTLKYALKLKRQGIIKKLTAGPVVVIFPDEYNSMIADENLELYLQPSQWAADLHIDIEPMLEGRCVPWPVGVDEDEFRPATEKKKGMVVIYHKCEHDQFCCRVDYLLRSYGYTTKVIKYGYYNLTEYKKALAECEFEVVISRQESQGIFLTEAWAMDVPTICFDPHYYMFYEPYHLEVVGNISTCPYLSEQTGLRFYEMSELDNILKNYEEYSKKFSPREWVLKNMTDEICANKFLEIVGLI